MVVSVLNEASRLNWKLFSSFISSWLKFPSFVAYVGPFCETIRDNYERESKVTMRLSYVKPHPITALNLSCPHEKTHWKSAKYALGSGYIAKAA